MSKKQQLTIKQAKFIKNKLKGHNNTESAIMAGYSPTSATTSASRLLRNGKVLKALEKAGLTDKTIADSLKVAMESGLSIKATNSDSLKAIDLITKLKGYQQKEEQPKELHQTNIYINELKQMSNDELLDKVSSIQEDIAKLK